MKFDLVIKDGQLVCPEGIISADMGICDNKIAAIDTKLSGTTEFNAANKLVIPGAIDSHVHFELDLERFITVDTFSKGSQAALLGGVTTIIDFATPKSTQSLQEAFLERKNQASKFCHIDFGLHMCVVNWHHDTAEQIQDLVTHYGVNSIKLFMNYKDRGWMADDYMLASILELSQQYGFRVLVHAENDDLISFYKRNTIAHEPYSHALSRPNITEWEAAQRAISINKDIGGHLYIVHISTPETVSLIQQARKENIDVTGETCPQYLLCNDLLLQKDDGYLYATCPPLRSLADMESLRKKTAQGGIHIIGTDTCSFSKEQKQMWQQDINKLAFGLHGVDVLVPATYHLATVHQLWSIEDWVKLIATNPAKIHGLYPQKGILAVDSDADLVILDPNHEHTITAKTTYSQSDFTPYENMTCQGWPVATVFRGQLVAHHGKIVGSLPQGEYLHRKRIYQ